MVLSFEGGEILYIALKDFHPQTLDNTLLYKRLMLWFMTTAIIISALELYIFRHALSMSVYSNSGFLDSYILIASNFPLMIIAGLLYSKYLSLMKTQRLQNKRIF